MKQAVLSMLVVMAAAGILTGMVLYTVLLMREAEMRLLTGELAVITANASIQSVQ